jgi:hypothetical protein
VSFGQEESKPFPTGFTGASQDFGVDVFGFSVKWLSLACASGKLVMMIVVNCCCTILLPVLSTVDLVGISAFYQWTSSRKILTEIRE